MDEPVPLSELSLALQAHADVAAMTEVLTSSLAGLLPADVVIVERRRTIADRLAKRPGTPIALTFDAGDRRLTLRADGQGRPAATSEHVVRGIRLSAHPIDIEQWIATLAAELQRLGSADQQARDALYRFLLE